MEEQQERIESEARPVQTERKPYEKPAITYDAPLEATASICSVSPGKVVPGVGGCTIGFS